MLWHSSNQCTWSVKPPADLLPYVAGRALVTVKTWGGWHNTHRKTTPCPAGGSLLLLRQQFSDTNSKSVCPQKRGRSSEGLEINYDCKAQSIKYTLGTGEKETREEAHRAVGLGMGWEARRFAV